MRFKVTITASGWEKREIDVSGEAEALLLANTIAQKRFPKWHLMQIEIKKITEGEPENAELIESLKELIHDIEVAGETDITEDVYAKLNDIIVDLEDSE